MFTEYFASNSRKIIEGLQKQVDKRGIVLPDKEKDLNLYSDLFTFLSDHMPTGLALATGKVRSKKHILNRNCDVLIFRKYCNKLLAMAGGYVIIDLLHSFMSVERDLTTENLYTHVALTNAMKSLYESVNEGDQGQAIPVFSVLFAYKSRVPLMSHKVALKDAARERAVPLNHEIDMVCILNEGLLIKDWDNNGEYKAVETGSDTLMWFYVLLMEYLDQEGNLKIDLRNYIKTQKEYKEY